MNFQTSKLLESLLYTEKSLLGLCQSESDLYKGNRLRMKKWTPSWESTFLQGETSFH